MSKYKTVGANDTLLLEYEFSHAGERLEANPDARPVEYEMGEGHWPIPIELLMMDEPAGAKLKTHLAAKDEVFGALDSERIVQMDVADFQSTPDLGALINFNLPDGGEVEGQVLNILGDTIEVDFNHPYAGRDIDVSIHIHSILSSKQ